MKRFVSFFVTYGVPKAGLTPSIKIVDLSDDSVVVNGTMTAIATLIGFYKYEFAGYSVFKEYAIKIDGGVALSASDRYQSAINEIGELERFNFANAKVENNQVILYDDLGELKAWDLFDASGVPSNLNTFKREI